MTESRLDPETLAELLIQWMPGQRWFAGKSRGITTLTVRQMSQFGPADARVQLWLADVTYDDGVQDTYQLPIAVSSEIDESLMNALIGEIGSGDGDVLHVYDAPWVRPVNGAWLDGIVAQTSADGIEFHLLVDADAIPAGEPGKVLTGEQSNSSIVYGDRVIMKLFRRLEHGMNPDIEVHEALARQGGRHVAPLLGYVQTTPDSQGEVTSLAMVQEFMNGATDGWSLAKNSVRDLMAEADLRADEAGGDFAGEAHRLGVATAEVHADMASALGTRVMSAADMRARADAMIASLDAAATLVEVLAPVADRLRTLYEDFAASPPLTAQRVHGDLHLGQVLRTMKGWVVLDFEGEPVRSIEHRREFDSPLRDVAGMMRSFDYAANHQVIDSGSNPQRTYRAVEWSERNRAAFCDGYAAASGVDPRDAAVQMRAFEADKAVYEAVYEARNRPAWLPVPLASLGRLLPKSAP